MSQTTTAPKLSLETPEGRGRKSRGVRMGAVRRLPRLLPVCDALAALVGIVLAYRADERLRPDNASELLLVLLITSVAWVAVLHLFGLYAHVDVRVPDEMRRLVGGTAGGTLAVTALSAWWSQPVTRPALSLLFLTALTFEVIGRSAVRVIVQRTGRDGSAAVRTAVVGTDNAAHDLAARLFSSTSFAPVGMIDGSKAVDPAPDGVPVIGSLTDVETVLMRNRVQRVYVAPSAISSDELELVSRACRRAGADLRISTNLTGIRPSRVVLDSCDGITTLAVAPVRLSGLQASLKRAFDVVVGATALVLALPLIAVVAIAIGLTSPGPVFFPQVRVTKGGRSFTMYKFRSMVTDADRALDGKVIDLTKPFFKLEDDPRLTPIGRKLRSLSLDEVPQLWNVVRGDMSLVGPRPLPLEQIEANREFLAPRHEVRAGMTGLWQISGRSELDSEDALRIDRFYIENWSLGLDVSILLQTFGAVLARRGAM